MSSLKDGLRYHAYTIKSGTIPPVPSSNRLISLYAKNGLLPNAQQLFDEIPQRNVFSWNAIISAHIKSQNLKQAETLFTSSPCRDIVTYNSMLSGYVNNEGHEDQAFNLFIEMQEKSDSVGQIDDFTLTTMLNLAAKVSAVSSGRQLHSFMVKTGNNINGFSVSSLIDMYSKCGCFREAHQVFKDCGEVLDLVSKNSMVAAFCREGELEMAAELFWKEPEMNNTVSWNTLLSGYSQNGCPKEALKLFVHMTESGIWWDEHTITSVLRACAGIRNLKQGKELHAHVLKKNLGLNPFISNAIVDVYSKCLNLKYAELIHPGNGVRNPFSIASMIVGYASLGRMAEAQKLFDSLPEKNSVVWTALFSGYIKSHNCGAVFELLKEFIEETETSPDPLILISVLGACGVHAALVHGKQIHAYILRTDIEIDEKMSSALVDMYSKCGNICYAETFFWRFAKLDIVLYNVMIAGYAHHGHEHEAIELFKQLVEKGMRPDAITFLALLSAFRHSGLVEMGEKYFNSMTEDYNISPEIDHYACMVDLYGRANQLGKAVEFMRRVPCELDVSIWGAFLSSCKLNGKVIYAKEAEENLLRLEGGNGARYVQLASVYAAERNWDEMVRIRKDMRGKEVKKMPGCSWVHTDNRVHIFTSSDTSHPKSEDIYSTLEFLIAEVKARFDDTTLAAY